MSDETRKALEAFIQKMLATADQAGAFAAEQTPLLVQEWLNWVFWHSILMSALCMVVILLLIFAARWVWTRPLPNNPNQARAAGEFKVFCVWVTMIGSVVMLFPLSINAVNALKVSIAPRVVILQQFTELVK